MTSLHSPAATRLNGTGSAAPGSHTSTEASSPRGSRGAPWSLNLRSVISPAMAWAMARTTRDAAIGRKAVTFGYEYLIRSDPRGAHVGLDRFWWTCFQNLLSRVVGTAQHEYGTPSSP